MVVARVTCHHPSEITPTRSGDYTIVNTINRIADTVTATQPARIKVQVLSFPVFCAILTEWRCHKAL